MPFLTNKTYYAAENTLMEIIKDIEESLLREKFILFVKNAPPNFNRELFDLFDIEESEPDEE